MSKLGLPKEYHLRKKKIFAVWKREKILFLSDEERVLKPETAGGDIFIPHIDANNRLEVPSGLNNHSAKLAIPLEMPREEVERFICERIKSPEE